ncbi:MAG: OmpH family outer membrane protein [Candidatus Ratteibacteria bacterium]|nr:OmpH family outer membrane protein [Candidatus Ratteibacteria bacterium]
MIFKNKLKFLPLIVLAIAFLILITILIQRKNPNESLALNEKSAPPEKVSKGNGVLIQTDAGAKFGFADFLTVYHSYSKTKIEDERLKAKGLEFQRKIDLDKDKISELEKKINSGVISEKEKEILNKEIEEIKTQITKNIKEFNSGIDSEQRQAIDKLIEDLRIKISNYGKEKGYIMIFDKNELIFSDTHYDLTREIVDYVNKNTDN